MASEVNHNCRTPISNKLCPSDISEWLERNVDGDSAKLKILCNTKDIGVGIKPFSSSKIEAGRFQAYANDSMTQITVYWNDDSSIKEAVFGLYETKEQWPYGYEGFCGA